MRVIANELAAALAAVPECFYGINPKPTDEIVYPYTVFGYSYVPATAADGSPEQPGIYAVTLEVDLFDRGPNAGRLLDTEQTVVDTLAHYRAMRSAAWSMARLDSAIDVPTLVDGLYRRNLQFSIKMTLRKG